ncbi:MAG: hypothetical protein GY866_27485, partial [Proteobacteria bacterium]|nr:hypothetical protein [Pseudomonadota bacterium]
MKDRNRIPVLVGIGQLVNKNSESAGEPLEYMAECARKAADDMEARDVLPKIDSLSVVNVISRKYVDPSTMLAEMLEAKPSDKVTTPIGATAPQGLTNRLCNRISKGESEIGLICGAEAFHSGKGKPDLSASGGGQNDSSTVQLFGDMRPPLSKTEIKYGLVMPSVVYPLFANAYRQAQGLSLDENLLQIGKFCEKYAK